jgi:hypothetical protein
LTGGGWLADTRTSRHPGLRFEVGSMALMLGFHAGDRSRLETEGYGGTR